MLIAQGLLLYNTKPGKRNHLIGVDPSSVVTLGDARGTAHRGRCRFRKSYKCRTSCEDFSSGSLMYDLLVMESRQRMAHVLLGTTGAVAICMLAHKLWLKHQDADKLQVTLMLLPGN